MEQSQVNPMAHIETEAAFTHTFTHLLFMWYIPVKLKHFQVNLIQSTFSTSTSIFLEHVIELNHPARTPIILTERQRHANVTFQ